MFIVLCVGRGLAMGWSPSKEFYRLCIGSRICKSIQASTESGRAIITTTIIMSVCVYICIFQLRICTFYMFICTRLHMYRHSHMFCVCVSVCVCERGGEGERIDWWEDLRRRRCTIPHSLTKTEKSCENPVSITYILGEVQGGYLWNRHQALWIHLSTSTVWDV
jgi:hypothetical protein